MASGVLPAVLIPLLFACSAHASQVSGIVWDGVGAGPAEGVAVEVNTTPLQRDITGPDGSYAFELPVGKYSLVVKRVTLSHELEQVASDSIFIQREGNYSMDILILYDDLDVQDIGPDPDFEPPTEQTGEETTQPPYAFIAAVFFIIALAYYVLTQPGKEKGAQEKTSPQTPPQGPGTA
ncbi:hypothetical protein COY95_02580, partial [Candidatus Woesearchaeota archaeon CG_4_10_14_0_8_um_filter_47_5]